MKLSAKRLVVPEPRLTRTSVREARSLWAEYKTGFGFSPVATPFGSKPTDNQKYGKSEQLIYGLSLAPASQSGINVCHWSTAQCRAFCVSGCGNGGYPSVVRSRIAKTRFLFEHPAEAAELLGNFWENARKAGALAEKVVGGRLNTFSDLDWQSAAPWIFEMFSSISFYDYTKNWNRSSRYDNYHLTYSASERSTNLEIADFLWMGKNVAIVFDTAPSKPLPEWWGGFRVIDADKTDFRPADPKGVVVGLRAKGKLRTANSPFVFPSTPGTGRRR